MALINFCKPGCFPRSLLQSALTYFYGHTISAIEICQWPGNEWRSVDNILVRTGKCLENEKEWVFHAPSAVSYPGGFSIPSIPDKKIAKEQAIVLKIHADGSISPETPLAAYRENLNKGKTYSSQTLLEYSFFSNLG